MLSSGSQLLKISERKIHSLNVSEESSGGGWGGGSRFVYKSKLNQKELKLALLSTILKRIFSCWFGTSLNNSLKLGNINFKHKDSWDTGAQRSPPLPLPSLHRSEEATRPKNTTGQQQNQVRTEACWGRGIFFGVWGMTAAIKISKAHSLRSRNYGFRNL